LRFRNKVQITQLLDERAIITKTNANPHETLT